MELDGFSARRAAQAAVGTSSQTQILTLCRRGVHIYYLTFSLFACCTVFMRAVLVDFLWRVLAPVEGESEPISPIGLFIFTCGAVGASALTLLSNIELCHSTGSGMDMLELRRLDCHPKPSAQRVEDSLVSSRLASQRAGHAVGRAPSMYMLPEANSARSASDRGLAVSSSGSTDRQSLHHTLQGVLEDVVSTGLKSGSLRLASAARGRPNRQRVLAVGCAWFDRLMLLLSLLLLDIVPPLAGALTYSITGETSMAVGVGIVAGGMGAMTIVLLFTLGKALSIFLLFSAVIMDASCCKNCSEAVTDPKIADFVAGGSFGAEADDSASSPASTPPSSPTISSPDTLSGLPDAGTKIGAKIGGLALPAGFGVARHPQEIPFVHEAFGGDSAIPFPSKCCRLSKPSVSSVRQAHAASRLLKQMPCCCSCCSGCAWLLPADTPDVPVHPFGSVSAIELANGVRLLVPVATDTPTASAEADSAAGSSFAAPVWRTREASEVIWGMRWSSWRCCASRMCCICAALCGRDTCRSLELDDACSCRCCGCGKASLPSRIISSIFLFFLAIAEFWFDSLEAPEIHSQSQLEEWKQSQRAYSSLKANYQPCACGMGCNWLETPWLALVAALQGAAAVGSCGCSGVQVKAAALGGIIVTVMTMAGLFYTDGVSSGVAMAGGLGIGLAAFGLVLTLSALAKEALSGSSQTHNQRSSPAGSTRNTTPNALTGGGSSPAVAVSVGKAISDTAGITVHESPITSLRNSSSSDSPPPAQLPPAAPLSTAGTMAYSSSQPAIATPATSTASAGRISIKTPRDDDRGSGGCCSCLNQDENGDIRCCLGARRPITTVAAISTGIGANLMLIGATGITSLNALTRGSGGGGAEQGGEDAARGATLIALGLGAMAVVSLYIMRALLNWGLRSFEAAGRRRRVREAVLAWTVLAQLANAMATSALCGGRCVGSYFVAVIAALLFLDRLRFKLSTLRKRVTNSGEAVFHQSPTYAVLRRSWCAGGCFGSAWRDQQWSQQLRIRVTDMLLESTPWDAAVVPQNPHDDAAGGDTPTNSSAELSTVTRAGRSEVAMAKTDSPSHMTTTPASAQRVANPLVGAAVAVASLAGIAPAPSTPVLGLIARRNAHLAASIRTVQASASARQLCKLQANDRALEEAAYDQPFITDGVLSSIPWRLSRQLRLKAEQAFGTQGRAKLVAVLAFLAFVVVLFVLLLSASLFVTDELRSKAAARVSRVTNVTELGAPQGYQLPVCNKRWGRNQTLTIIDMALLTSLTYAYDNFDTDFDAWFRLADPQGEWKAVTRLNTSDDSVAEFISIESEPYGIQVVGIRGTTTGRDALSDLDIWGEATALRALLSMLPGASFMDDRVSSWVAGFLASAATALRSPSGIRKYWTEPVKYVNSRLSNPEARARFPQTVVVGHSLGGGIAKIVASITGSEAVAFEPPGMLFARVKFGITKADLFARTFTFALDRDPVAAMSDKQAAGIQWAQCPPSLPAAACHSLRGIAEMLVTNCGDRLSPSRALDTPEAWRYAVRKSASAPRSVASLE